MDEVRQFPGINSEISFIMPLFVYLDYSVVAATAVRLIAAVAWWAVIYICGAIFTNL